MSGGQVNMTISISMIVTFIVFLILMWLVYIGIDRFVVDGDLKKFLTYILLVLVVLGILGIFLGGGVVHFAR